MVPLDYGSPVSLKSFLQAEGLHVQKRLGQHFLIAPHSRELLYHALRIDKNSSLWEIGPGLGAMTVLFLKAAASVRIFEIDHGFVRVLRKIFQDSPACAIVAGDFLKTGIPLLEKGEVPDRLAGNLPYGSGSAMIYRIAEIGNVPPCSVFTLQREVANRMTARPGRKDYSLFSVVCQFVFDVEDLGEIGPGAFYPAPDVVSKIVRLSPHGRDRGLRNRDFFFRVAKSLFASRRKTIKNNLISNAPFGTITREHVTEACRGAGIEPGQRGEELSVDRIMALTESLEACAGGD